MYDSFSFIEQRFLIISSLSDQYGGLILLVLTDNTTHEQVLGEVRAQSHGLNERGGPSVPVLRSDFRCMKRLGAWSTTASPLPPSLPPPPPGCDASPRQGKFTPVFTGSLVRYCILGRERQCGVKFLV